MPPVHILVPVALVAALALDQAGKSCHSIRSVEMVANTTHSAPPTLAETIDSSYGSYSLAGCFDAGSSGYTLTGSTTTSTSMTLQYCASYCKGSAYFAIMNGETPTP